MAIHDYDTTTDFTPAVYKGYKVKVAKCLCKRCGPRTDGKAVLHATIKLSERHTVFGILARGKDNLTKALDELISRDI